MAAEAELNGLKKLESNKYCVNCDAYNKFGHGNICEKFKTFVCSNCKSAHQSFSMRVKSVTMSNWTKEEVDALKEENGGGNAVAKRVWLGNWDESKLRKPKEGDHVDVYKRFIDKVYNDRAFYDESAASNPSPSKKSGGSSRNVTAAPATSSSSSSAANLLDFSSPTASSSAPTFDAFASPPKSASPANDGWGAFSSAPAPAPVSAASSTGFDDGFGAFMAAPAAPANPMAAFDPFASSSSSVSAPPSSSSSFAAPSQPAFDPFAPSNAALIAPSQSFGFGGAPQAPAPMARPPPANFSAFDALAGPPPGMGGMGGMGMGGGMGIGGPRPGMMHGNMGIGMGMGMGMPQQPAMGMGMGMGGGPRPMMGGANGYMAAPPQNAYGARPGVNGSVGSRDPFAGLGLPGK